MEIPGKLVVRTYAPARRFILLAVTVLLGLAAVYLMFELGRQQAGFDGIQAAQERARLEDQIAEMQNDAHQLRVQLDAFDQTIPGCANARALVNEHLEAELHQVYAAFSLAAHADQDLKTRH